METLPNGSFCLVQYARSKTINGDKPLLGWVTLPTTNTSIANHWLDPRQHGERQNNVRSNFRKLIFSSFQAGKGLKAFKLVKTINSLKAKKKEGKEQNWAKLLKKTESYKEIFNLFDKVTSEIISSSDGMVMHALLSQFLLL